MKKASERIKVSIDLEQIEKLIIQSEKNDYQPSCHKIFLHHATFINDETKIKLMDLGYKVYVGDWDGIMKGALIIEW